MFTGIIQAVGKVREPVPSARRAPRSSPPDLGLEDVKVVTRSPSTAPA